MTPAQIELARHALGLPNERHRSYRNHFVAGEGHDDYVQHGCGRHGARQEYRLAVGRRQRVLVASCRRAKAALQPGEGLDPEDFPGVVA